MTEQTLADHGVYGNRLQVIYDLLIKNPGEDNFHKVVIVDEFVIASSYYYNKLKDETLPENIPYTLYALSVVFFTTSSSVTPLISAIFFTI